MTALLRLLTFLSFSFLAVAADKPALWRDPGPVASLDCAAGAGGPDGAPQAPFFLVEEEEGGSTPKLLVRDARRALWSVKWGEEARAEVFATRLLWAAGYLVEPAYFVASGSIDGVGALRRAESQIDRRNGNRFAAARFERRDEQNLPLAGSNWSFADSPFRGTPELQGLKVMIMLVSNWDVKDSRSSDGPNTAIVPGAAPDGDRELRHLITDWGATMGKWGHIASRSKWDCKGYAAQSREFVKGVEGGMVRFGYEGKRTEDIAGGIRVQDVSWLLQRLGGVTDAQLRAALGASGASAEETECFAGAVRQRIGQLQGVVGR